MTSTVIHKRRGRATGRMFYRVLCDGDLDVPAARSRLHWSGVTCKRCLRKQGQ